MKILRVVVSMDPKTGGVVEAINQAALTFNEIDGFKMDVLCLDQPNASWVLSSKKYSIYAIGNAFTSYNISFKYINWLMNHAKEYDLIIIDGLWQFLSVGGYILKILNVPYMVFTHGMLDPYFNANKLKYFKKLPFWFLVERNILSLSKSVIFTCKEEMNLASTSFPFYKARPQIATLGVEGNNKDSILLRELFMSEFPALKNKRFGLYLSRINKKKGLDMLIDAISQLTVIPDDFIFAIAGPDSNNLKKELSIQIERLGITNKIIWLGMLEGDIKWGAYHASEFFILPSHQENFGIVVAEALSTSTPVLITNKVNIWREIHDAFGGFVANDNVAGIKRLLNSWFSLNETEQSQMKSNAKVCYINHFSTISATRDFEKVLLSIS